MANNRYFMHCKCGKLKYLGKSLGDGIYNNASVTPGLFTPQEILSKPSVLTIEDPNRAQAEFLEGIYKWMWEHMFTCFKAPKSLTQEWHSGKLFDVITEYDKRVDYSKKELIE